MGWCHSYRDKLGSLETKLKVFQNIDAAKSDEKVSHRLQLSWLNCACQHCTRDNQKPVVLVHTGFPDDPYGLCTPRSAGCCA